jgi:hypothetical protein
MYQSYYQKKPENISILENPPVKSIFEYYFFAIFTAKLKHFNFISEPQPLPDQHTGM